MRALCFWHCFTLSAVGTRSTYRFHEYHAGIDNIVMAAPSGDISSTSCGLGSSSGGPRHCKPKVFVCSRYAVFSVPGRHAPRREYEGRILLHGSYVFLDVVWLAVILKPILIHNDKTLHDGSISLQVDDNQSTVLSEQAHKESWENLKTQGILEIELAHVLWPDGLWNYVLGTLESIDLAFPLPRGRKKLARGNEKLARNHGKLARDYEDLVVMLRLPVERPQSVAEDLKDFRNGSYKAIGGTWKMFLGAPPGAIEKVLVRCCRLGATQIFWRFGVLIKGSFGGVVGGRFALLLEYVDNQLLIEIHGNLRSVGPWMALSYAMSAMLSMVQNSPGLPWEASIGCPEHKKMLLKISEKVSISWRTSVNDISSCGGLPSAVLRGLKFVLPLLFSFVFDIFVSRKQYLVDKRKR